MNLNPCWGVHLRRNSQLPVPRNASARQPADLLTLVSFPLRRRPRSFTATVLHHTRSLNPSNRSPKPYMYSLKKCTGRRNKSQARTKRLAGRPHTYPVHAASHTGSRTVRSRGLFCIPVDAANNDLKKQQVHPITSFSWKGAKKNPPISCILRSSNR